jgi:hypothetical protein
MTRAAMTIHHLANPGAKSEMKTGLRWPLTTEGPPHALTFELNLEKIEEGDRDGSTPSRSARASSWSQFMYD